MMAAAIAPPADSGLTSAVCSALSLSRASVLRHRAALTAPQPARKARAPSSRALPDRERDQVLLHLREPRFADQTPTEVFATLLDEGTYLCSIRTMYRILAAQGEVAERRRQRTHPVYVKPELLAIGPNEVWSWDITKLMGPVKWSYFYLYVILDIFSRRVVGWRIEHAESAAQFKELFIDAVDKHAVPRDQLTLHADRGGPMKAKTTALMLVDLGVLKSHSRPHTSNDNPFSEAHFKTLKYQPEFPRNFATIEQARAFCRRFFAWYNQDHHHAGIGLMTPDQIHFGQAETVYAARQATLDLAFLTTPERFVRKPPKPPQIPTAVWINPPKPTEETQA
jgi:transposase InsO family protein